MKHRHDKNHSRIANSFRQLGWSVADTSMVGNGFPDIVIGRKDRNYLVEIKSENGKLRQTQIEFRDAWRGGKPLVIRSVDDVIGFVTWFSGRHGA